MKTEQIAKQLALVAVAAVVVFFVYHIKPGNDLQKYGRLGVLIGCSLVMLGQGGMLLVTLFAPAQKQEPPVLPSPAPVPKVPAQPAAMAPVQPPPPPPVLVPTLRPQIRACEVCGRQSSLQRFMGHDVCVSCGFERLLKAVNEKCTVCGKSFPLGELTGTKGEHKCGDCQSGKQKAEPASPGDSPNSSTSSPKVSEETSVQVEQTEKVNQPAKQGGREVGVLFDFRLHSCPTRHS